MSHSQSTAPQEPLAEVLPGSQREYTHNAHAHTMNVYTHTCTNTFVHIPACTHIHTSAHTQRYTYIQRHTNKYPMFIYAHNTHMHIQPHVYIHVCINTCNCLSLEHPCLNFPKSLTPYTHTAFQSHLASQTYSLPSPFLSGLAPRC